MSLLRFQAVFLPAMTHSLAELKPLAQAELASREGHGGMSRASAEGGLETVFYGSRPSEGSPEGRRPCSHGPPDLPADSMRGTTRAAVKFTPRIKTKPDSE
jgi:hypothetical protein